MKCIVIDDERIAREGLADFIREFEYLENAGLFPNPIPALEIIKSVDLIFLDIQMPALSGLEFAKLIQDQKTMIIFTTAHAGFAIEGYHVNAVGYLLKPIFFEDFTSAVQKAKKMYDLLHQGKPTYEPIFFKENGIHLKVDPSRILYLRGLQNYVEVNLENNQRNLVHQTLKGLYELLPENLFLQIHKSYIINTSFISRIEGPRIYLGDIGLPIARDRKKEICNLLLKMGLPQMKQDNKF